MKYYEYIRNGGEIYQFETTERDMESNGVVQVSKEKFDFDMEESKERNEEVEYQEYLASGGTLNKSDWLCV